MISTNTDLLPGWDLPHVLMIFQGRSQYWQNGDIVFWQSGDIHPIFAPGQCWKMFAQKIAEVVAATKLRHPIELSLPPEIRLQLFVGDQFVHMRTIFEQLPAEFANTQADMGLGPSLPYMLQRTRKQN